MTNSSLKDRPRHLEPEQAEESSGPIRRRIKALTIKLEPFETSLTNQEATNVRNTIESLLKDYFFKEQPWAIRDESGAIIEVEGNSESGRNSNGNRNSLHDESAIRESDTSYIPPEGSVTYVGLAQILENKQTEDENGAELTMNGLVYFAEGSKNIPDENELLQTMETKALGDSKVVVEALQDFFPTQQQLVVTVETPFSEDTPAAAATVDLPIAETENLGNDIVIEPIVVPIEPPPPAEPWSDTPVQEPSDSNPVVMGRIESEPSSVNMGALGGGVAVGLAVIAVLFGLFAIKRRKSRKEGEEFLVGMISSSDEEQNDAENGMHHGWKASSRQPKKPASLALDTDPESEVSSPNSTTKSYLTSVFRRKSPIAEQHLDMANAANETRSKARGSILDSTHNITTTNDDVNLSNFEFTDDGLSDFDSVVSIQPHMVNLQSLESFEERHHNITGRHEFIVQKDQLGSSFEEAPTSLLGEMGASNPTQQLPANKLLMSNTHTGATAASGGDLSYSSSETSSQQQLQDLLLLQKNSSEAVADEQELEDEREDQRIRYSMMPNPYVHNKSTVYGRQKAAEATVKDRSAPCVLQSTDFTASTLAKGRKSTSSSGSDAGSSHSMGMIPKLAAPAWWTSQDGGDDNGSKRNGVRSSAAVAAAYREDDLAYSGDEENTFGVADSDGWDPADAELSSMGDAPTHDEMKLLDFHPGMVGSRTSSAANITPVKASIKQEPPGASFVGNKYQEPPGISPLRPIKPSSPPSSANVEAAKTVLQKMKSSSDSDENNKSVDSIEAAKSILYKMKSSPENYHQQMNGGGTDRHKLGESIAVILDSDTSAEEIKFDSDTMEI